MEQINEFKNVRIVYFSGTGGTKRVADAFEKELKDRGCEAAVKNLGASIEEKKSAPAEPAWQKADLNIIIYPVYAADAPRPVYEWVRSTTGEAAGEKTAVISVSGGGEGWPNTGCRQDLCKALEERGFQVVYDRMLCMPANVLAQESDHAIMWMLRVIPQKVSGILDELLAGKVKRTGHKKGPLMRWMSKSEQANSGKFGQSLKVSDDCTRCGWCVRNCPTQNISITGPSEKPKFSDRCIICTRCFYGCPAKAIKAGGPLPLKKGFDLDAVERRMEGVELMPIKQCCKGIAFKNVRNYLLGRD